jgi:hypothetical protein
MTSLDLFFQLTSNPSGRTMALGSTQPMTDMSTRNLPGGKEQLANNGDNHIAIRDSTVYEMWDP